MHNLDQDEVHTNKLHMDIRRCTSSTASMLLVEAMSYMAVAVSVILKYNLAKIRHAHGNINIRMRTKTINLMILTTRTSSG